MLDVPFHQHLKAAEAPLAGLVHRLGPCPVIMSDPVAGDDHAGPVGAAPAMHEDRAKCRIVQYRQYPVNLMVRGREEPGQPDSDIPQTGCFHRLLFPRLMIHGASQVEHSPNSAFRQV